MPQASTFAVPSQSVPTAAAAATCATVVAQVPAAAAALVSWANWAAAPFTRNAMDYIAGSVVADAA
jgi:hypothetical protein